MGKRNRNSGQFSSPDLVFWVGLLILGAYAAFRISSTLPVVQEMRVDWDTHQYVEISKFAIWERGFWAGIKPFTTPLVFKLVGRDRTAVGVFFLIFSTLSWSFFSFQVFRSMTHPLAKLGGMSFFLVFSLIRQITGWDGFLISESISFSLLVLFLSMWLALLRGWKWWKAVVLLVVAFFWVFARDTNAYLALMISIPLVVFALVSRSNRPYLWIGAGLVVFFGLSTATANLGQRWVVPFHHVLTHRVWRSEEDTAFFTACGMPADEKIDKMLGELWVDQEWALYDDLMAWTLESGKQCYYRWLLSNIGRSLREPLADLALMLGYHKKLYAPRYEQLLPQRVENLIYPYQRGVSLVWLAFLGVGLSIRPRMLRNEPRWIIPIGLILLFIPHGIIVWHGDAADIDRHSLQAGISFFIGFWMLAMYGVDKGLVYLGQRWQEQRK
jgi:hypothetical protein